MAPMAQLYVTNGMERVYFTDPALAENLLMGGAGGGINCIIKLPGFASELALIQGSVQLGGSPGVTVQRGPSEAVRD